MNKCRYIFTPAARPRGMRITLADRIRRWRWQRNSIPDVYPICGYERPYGMKK